MTDPISFDEYFEMRGANGDEPALEMGDQRLTLSEVEADLEQKRAEILAALGGTRKATKLLDEFEATASLRGVLIAQRL